MKTSIIVLTGLVIFGCTSPYKNTQVNPVPKYSFVNKTSVSRGPASVNETKPTKVLKFSNKALYFHTLLSQYNKIGSMFPKLSEPIRSCPSFHSSISNYKNSRRSNREYRWNQSALVSAAGTEKSEIYPELQLKTKESTVELDLIQGKDVTETMKIAMSKLLERTKAELIRLCDVSHSQNYFIFENFVTFHKENPGFTGSAKALPALMKTTIFSNMYLIHSLKHHQKQGRQLASMADNLYENEALRRLGVNWSKRYFQSLSSRKANDLAKYVQP